MTAVIAPGMPFAIPASTTANAPPSGTPDATGPVGTFAALLAVLSTAMEAGVPAPTSTSADGSAVVDGDVLQALLAKFANEAGGDTQPEPPQPTDETPLLDRPAGVEAAPTGTEPGTTSMESLMAGLLLARPQQPPDVEHALPGGDLLRAVTETPTEGTPMPWSGLASKVEAQATAVAQTTDVDDGTRTSGMATPAQSDAGTLVLSADARPVTAPSSQSQPGSAGSGSDAAPEWETPESLTEVRPAEMPEPEAPVSPATVSPAIADGREATSVAASVAQTPVVTPAASQPVVRTVAAANAPMEVAEIVRGAVIDGDDRVVLRLDPPELGTLEVHIERQNGAIRVRVEASQAGARELIEQALPALQQALEARDLRVERLEVRGLADAASGRSATEQGGQSGRDRQSRQDETPEWSPVAAIDGVMSDGPSKGDGATSARLDVMA